VSPSSAAKSRCRVRARSFHELRYPDRSVVIDLSCLEHDAKFDYIRSVLPAVNVMRRRAGTPHRIVVDERHYFLRNAIDQRLLDFDVQRIHGRNLVAFATPD
jgi:hypothetical protein